MATIFTAQNISEVDLNDADKTSCIFVKLKAAKLINDGIAAVDDEMGVEAISFMEELAKKYE